jgi:hypothetical protein
MDLCNSVQSYFQEAVADAIRNQGVATSEPTECYLVNLLSDFATASLADDEPLALKLATAREAAPAVRLVQLREVADKSLYLSGFFADSLTRRALDIGYYIELGGQAYGQLAIHHRKHQVFGVVYDDLAQRFRVFVDVLAEISGRATSSHLDAIQLYERWLRTGSEWMERRLRALGMLPGPKDVS